MKSRERPPPVSIGVPVYNGERYLAETLDSILAQTFGDFELILSDNASTDRTEAICREYARRDPRIRYYRNDRNLGAAPNYNRVFRLSRGEFFKWASSDDVLAPEYLRKCVEALRSRPEAVLCQSLIEGIDSEGRSLGVYDSRLIGSDSGLQNERFAALVLRPHACTEVFGLIRREALKRTGLLPNHHGCDRVLLAELALKGPFIQIREPLFKLREHGERYTVRAANLEERTTWHDTRRKRAADLPTWRLYLGYFNAAKKLGASRGERARCYRHLLKWWFVNWNLARAVVDVLAIADPDAVGRAEKFKQRFISPRPGAFTRKKGREEKCLTRRVAL